jgi:hypothetical protein
LRPRTAAVTLAEMDPATARNLAHSSHAGQLTPNGMALDEHEARVAADVPLEARAVAILHDVLEWTETCRHKISASPLTATDERGHADAG